MKSWYLNNNRFSKEKAGFHDYIKMEGTELQQIVAITMVMLTAHFQKELESTTLVSCLLNIVKIISLHRGKEPLT